MINSRIVANQIQCSMHCFYEDDCVSYNLCHNILCELNFKTSYGLCMLTVVENPNCIHVSLPKNKIAECVEVRNLTTKTKTGMNYFQQYNCFSRTKNTQRFFINPFCNVILSNYWVMIWKYEKNVSIIS